MWSRLWKTWWHLARALELQGLQLHGYFLIRSLLWVIFTALASPEASPNAANSLWITL